MDARLFQIFIGFTFFFREGYLHWWFVANNSKSFLKVSKASVNPPPANVRYLVVSLVRPGFNEFKLTLSNRDRHLNHHFFFFAHNI